MCRWWSGCTDSWGAPAGRPRRTKPRDWCSSARWDAGPSDNLWSQREGGWRGRQGEQSPTVRRVEEEDGRFGYRPVLCWRMKGSIQRADCFSLCLTSSRCLLSSLGVTIEVSHSPLRSISREYSPDRKVNNIRLANALCLLFFSVCLCCPPCFFFFKCYMDRKPGRNTRMSAGKKAMDAHLTQRLA